MKKIRSYTGNAYAFHQSVLDAKKEGTLKSTISAMATSYADCFEKYNCHFDDDTLQELEPIAVSPEQRNAMLELYSFRLKPFINLFKLLTTDNNNRSNPICPICTINNVNSFDHVIPKSEFPEYVDHPLNLIPCCSVCNGKKTNIWRNDRERVFLNLYIDELPNLQYLFVDSELINDIPVFHYYLQRPAEMDVLLYKRISSHYQSLDLCNRFADNSDCAFDEFRVLIVGMVEGGADAVHINHAMMKVVGSYKEKYGYNYWKSILLQHCLQKDEIFLLMQQSW